MKRYYHELMTKVSEDLIGLVDIVLGEPETTSDEREHLERLKSTLRATAEWWRVVEVSK